MTKKHLYLVPTVPEPYRFKDKIKPFLRGLLGASPLVEVAIEGLGKAVPDERKREYEERILKKGTTEQIYAAIVSGLGEECQERMAEAFSKRYKLTLLEYTEKINSSESGMHGHSLMLRGAQYVTSTMEQIIRLFRSRKLTSQKAQLELASMVACDGGINQAKELVASETVTSLVALQLLRAKAGEKTGYDA